MRQEPHPITGAIFREVGEGLVRVEDEAAGKWGLFRFDGSWIEGPITHADPAMLHFVGGPDMPPGTDIYWGMLPPDPADPEFGNPAAVMTAVGRAVQQPDPVVARYTGDAGIETEEGRRPSSWLDQDFFLDNDRYPDLLPAAFRARSPMPGGPAKVSTERFISPDYAEREVEAIWKRCWQMACREDDIPEIGDYHVYDIANLSFVIVRTGEHAFKAHVNACLHRGRQLCEQHGSGARVFRCPYHGWSWNIDGSLKEITTEWDFPGVREEVSQLPGAQVATWGGFVFINPDPEAEPLEDYLGEVMLGHFAKYRFETRYKQAHISRLMNANWKITMEAFMEGYHVLATHPQMTLAGGDASDSRYDVFGNFGRAGHVGTSTSSPQRGIIGTPEQALAHYRATADMNRAYLRGIIGDAVDTFSDAEMNDTTFNDLFPNLHPWGGWGRFVFRFRPNGMNPDESIMDIMMLAPWPEDRPKPPAARVQHLGPGDSWTKAPALGSFARVLDQDVFNLPKIQKGLKYKQPPHVWYGAYQEGKIRNFHRNYDRRMGIAEESGTSA